MTDTCVCVCAFTIGKRCASNAHQRWQSDGVKKRATRTQSPSIRRGACEKKLFISACSHSRLDVHLHSHTNTHHILWIVLQYIWVCICVFALNCRHCLFAAKSWLTNYGCGVRCEWYSNNILWSPPRCLPTTSYFIFFGKSNSITDIYTRTY